MKRQFVAIIAIALVIISSFSPAYATAPTWHDNTENTRIESAKPDDEGGKQEINDWGSSGFTAEESLSTEKASEQDSETRSMSSEKQAAAVLAAAAAGAALIRRRAEP